MQRSELRNLRTSGIMNLRCRLRGGTNGKLVRSAWKGRRGIWCCRKLADTGYKVKSCDVMWSDWSELTSYFSIECKAHLQWIWVLRISSEKGFPFSLNESHRHLCSWFGSLSCSSIDARPSFFPLRPVSACHK